jgi:hypothetical protein
MSEVVAICGLSVCDAGVGAVTAAATAAEEKTGAAAETAGKTTPMAVGAGEGWE